MKNRIAFVRVGTALLARIALVIPVRSFAVTATTNYAFATQKDVFMTEL